MQQRMTLGKLAAVKVKTHHTFKAVANEYLEHKRATLRSQSLRAVELHLLVPVKTLHDPRCTFVTPAANIYIIEVVPNRVSSSKAGVAGRHNGVPYETEKRQAFDRWAKYLMAITEGRESNATPAAPTTLKVQHARA